uniref:Ig-like domain-containing protein n=1 Tax=Scleropages formosus TaxID=113540 RepID=A0A8C9T9E3_SCLFO
PNRLCVSLRSAGLHVLQWFASALLQDEKLITAFFKLAYAGMEILRYNSLTNELSAPPQRDVLDESLSCLLIMTDEGMCNNADKCDTQLNTKQQGERSLISDGSLTGSDLCDPSVQPTVRVIRKTEPDSGRTRVSCVATGFYPRRVNVTLLRDDRPVPDRELTGGQVLPNGDGTYQSLSVSEEELRERHRYTCTVSHLSVDNKLDVNWVLWAEIAAFYMFHPCPHGPTCDPLVHEALLQRSNAVLHSVFASLSSFSPLSCL